MFRLTPAVLLFELCLLGVLGCQGSGDPNQPVRVPAEVKVTYKGAPVADAHVTLNPVASGAKSAFGRTDAQGVAKLSTLGGDDGAVPGEYQVTISKTQSEGSPGPAIPNDPMAPPANAEAAPPPKAIDLLPSKYNSAETSGLKATVSEGSDNQFSFELVE